MSARGRSIASRCCLVAVIALTGLIATANGRAHDFTETRRLVLSVGERQVELLVAYELRPSPLAEALRAQFDADHDDVIDTAWERLARSRVMLPRLHRGLAVEVDGRRLSFYLERLDFPVAPVERGRPGLSALALFRAEMPGPAAPVRRIRLRGGDPPGLVIVEAQAEEGLTLRSDSLPHRPGDPVLGPAVLKLRGVIELTVEPESR